MKKICEKALNHYGKANQIEKLKEELLELSLGLQRKDRTNTLEELADVEIMLFQFNLILSEEERAKVAEWVIFKLNRLERRINENI